MWRGTEVYRKGSGMKNSYQTKAYRILMSIPPNLCTISLFSAPERGETSLTASPRAGKYCSIMKSASALGIIILTKEEMMKVQMEKGMIREKPVEIKAAKVLK